jgi:hypothetical protein|nr:MAG TPA: major capsid protein [Caudoviricetes sp.]
MTALNYAQEYQRSLEQAFPYVLYFGALYATPNNGRYRWLNGKTIEIPSISVTGRVDSTRDTIATAARNYDNSWIPLTLANERKWSTLVHPRDVQETNQVTTIANITKVFNEEQKFPEMDAYSISKIYADWTAQGEKADTTVLSTENILSVFDKFLEEMSEGRVPKTGLLLYVTPAVNTLLKSAQGIYRTLNVGTQNRLSRAITALEEVEISEVPSELMKTLYNFTQGWKPAAGAKQVNMMLINPISVITPTSYEFAKLDPPSALSEGKYVYYEESHEDVFVLKNKNKGIRMSVEA